MKYSIKRILFLPSASGKALVRGISEELGSDERRNKI